MHICILSHITVKIRGNVFLENYKAPFFLVPDKQMQYETKVGQWGYPPVHCILPSFRLYTAFYQFIIVYEIKSS